MLFYLFFLFLLTFVLDIVTTPIVMRRYKDAILLAKGSDPEARSLRYEAWMGNFLWMATTFFVMLTGTIAFDPEGGGFYPMLFVPLSFISMLVMCLAHLWDSKRLLAKARNLATPI